MNILYSKDIKGRHAAWTCSMACGIDMQNGHSEWTCGMDIRHGHVNMYVHIQVRTCTLFSHIHIYIYTCMGINRCVLKILFRFVSPNFLTKFRQNETKHGLSKIKFRRNSAKFRFVTKQKKSISGKP